MPSPNVRVKLRVLVFLFPFKKKTNMFILTKVFVDNLLFIDLLKIMSMNTFVATKASKAKLLFGKRKKQECSIFPRKAWLRKINVFDSAWLNIANLS